MSYFIKFVEEDIYLFSGIGDDGPYICINEDSKLWKMAPDEITSCLVEALKVGKVYDRASQVDQYFKNGTDPRIVETIVDSYRPELMAYLDNPYASIYYKDLILKGFRAKELRETKKLLCRHAPKSLREQVLERDHYKCRYCGEKANSSDPLDHIIPYSLGGLTEESNLVTACTKCNSKKSNKTLAECGFVLLPVGGL